MNPESEGLKLGVERYRSRLRKLRSASLETSTPAANRVLIETVTVVGDALRSWLHHAKNTAGRLHSVVPLIENMDQNLVSMLTSRTILDGITVPRTINSLAMSVGRYLEDEAKFLHARRNHKGWWRKWSKLAKKYPVDSGRSRFLRRVAKESHLSLPSWTPKERCAVGIVCIEVFRQSTGIVDIVTEPGPAMKSVTVVRATDDFLKWLEKSHSATEILHPVFLPTVKKPTDWNSLYLGGYSDEALGKRPLIKTRNRKYLNDTNLRDMPTVYRAVNTIQSTGFTVNSKVLEVLKHCWERGLSVGDLPEREPRAYPEKPPEDSEKQAKKSWWKQVARIKFENECERSKKISVAKTIWLAEKYTDRKFYYPQECDFRGRVYPTPVFLNVQGADYSRALLTFSEPSVLDSDAVSWLAIHGANCWGHDKVSYKDRLEVISKNHALIMDIGKDPIGNMEWAKADKPFAFLAFCIEWHKVHTEGPVSSLPVHLDGSNNGLQIFSLLLKDPVAGLATNCLPCDAPRDIYADVAQRLVSKLESSPNPHARKWIEFGIDRKTTKRIVMCMPYGLTKFSSHEYVRDWYLDRVKAVRPDGSHYFSIDVVFDAIKFLTELLWQSIEEIVFSARACMDWLKEIAKIHVENDIPIRWTAPNGLLVEQAYRKTSRVTVKTSVGSVVRQHRIIQETGGLSMPRNVNGISPNFVHSLDASVLMLAVCHGASLGIDSFSCIHDSIGIKAAHASAMSSVIREAAIEVFSEPVLEQVRDEMSFYLGKPLPDPPPFGTMDITALRDADYFFA